MGTNILEITGLKKSFGDKKVLQGVDLAVPENSVFGFIGRNGAGKTTTMKAILGLLKVDEGEIRVCGEKVVYGETPTNRYIGYLPDVPQFYRYMTAKEYLKLCGRISGMEADEIESRSNELLELVGLAGERHKIKGYSRGMHQRLGIAQALMGKPRLLICDEPTSALDPVGRKDLLELLQAARKQTSVLFSTHILSDVQKICDHVALLEGGKIMASGSIDEIRGLGTDPGIELTIRNSEDTERIFRAFPEAEFRGNNEFAGNVIVFKNASEETAGRIMGFLAAEHISVIRFERKEADLEEMFMETIGK